MSFPRMVEVRQKFSSDRIDDIQLSTRNELAKIKLQQKVKPGMRIAITAGSRGITNIAEILKTVVEEVKNLGGVPYIVPTMGSHGGATPQGQKEVLRSQGIIEESMGALIISSLEVEQIGKLEDGTPVFIDRQVLKADGIILVARVKPHTDFKDKIESGLMKMAVVGLGKQKGAEILHSFRFEGYHKYLPLLARYIIERLPILAGLAIVENMHHQTSIVKAILPEQIEQEEKKLLIEAKRLLPRIPFKDIDVLIIDEIGKNISGAGMDTNVTGRYWSTAERQRDPDASNIKMIVVLDLSEETHGSAVGLGLADLTTKRAFDKIDFDVTFTNCLTSGWVEVGKIPIFLPNDRDAILTAIRLCGPIDEKDVKMVRIKNTLDLEVFHVSENLAEEIEKDERKKKELEIISKPKDMQFDVLGFLAR